MTQYHSNNAVLCGLSLAFVALSSACTSGAPPTPGSRCGEYATSGAPGHGGAPGGAGGTIAMGGAGSASASKNPPAPDPAKAGITPPLAPGGTVVTDAYARDVSIRVHARVNTVLEVTWNQAQPAEASWLEFSVAGEPPMTSRPSAGIAGPKRDVVLGVPGDSDVSVRVVSKQADLAYKTPAFSARTRAVPGGMPKPQVLAYDPDLASPERWLFGSVEASEGGSAHDYYFGTFWLYIMDRQGRVVWYWADPASNATTSFQRRARDGEYIVLEKRCFGCSDYRETIVKMTLDSQYFEEIPVEGLSDCIDVTDDGGILYDADHSLKELTTAGRVRTIWSCREHFGPGFHCYTNTINWNAATDTVLMSYPYTGTVVEVSRETGELVGQYGNAPGSWRFAPPSEEPPDVWSFAFQHFPNLSAAGTLMVSSHMPGCEDTNHPVAYQHAFLEFEIDRRSRTLVEKWRYTEGPEWPRAKGMALRLGNGNTLANYGTGGVIREITLDKKTAWHVKFDVPYGIDFYNRMVGHNELIDDLYSLNGGPHPL